jgi:hypothetical protein
MRVTFNVLTVRFHTALHATYTSHRCNGVLPHYSYTRSLAAQRLRRALIWTGRCLFTGGLSLCSWSAPLTATHPLPLPLRPPLPPLFSLRLPPELSHGQVVLNLMLLVESSEDSNDLDGAIRFAGALNFALVSAILLSWIVLEHRTKSASWVRILRYGTSQPGIPSLFWLEG